MSFKGKVYRPAEVEVTINEIERLFKIFPDGDIYEIKRTTRYPKTVEELMMAVAHNEEPPYTVQRDTIRKIKNRKIEQVVFHKYLSDLEKRQEETPTASL